MGYLLEGLINKQTDTSVIRYRDKCDKYDYLIAIGTGAIAGIVDIMFVGSPMDSKLGKWTDAQVDNCVKAFAKTSGWSPRAGKENSTSSAIGFLEKKFSVNYDQRHSGDVGRAFSMSAKNHHMKSLAHSPDVIGLFFSILSQFTGTSAFLANGKLITISSETMELQGGNFIAKIFSGVVNWFGHLMSDIAGSSGASGRGSGIVMPFYELFGLCHFGKFNASSNPQKPVLNDLATIATKAFESGYDARFALTMAIPVLISDLLTRLVWAIRHHFQYHKPIQECLPTKKHDDLRVMLIVSNGVLCLFDGVDAAIRSGGNWVLFFTRLNLIAWMRLIILVLKEVMIRCGIETPLDALKRTYEAVTAYMQELEKIDIEAFRKETERYNAIASALNQAKSETELNAVLYTTFEQLNIPLPWKGDFDTFMSNKENRLVFE